MVNDWATFCPFCCNLQSIFTKFKHTQVTPCGKRHTPLFLISIFLLVAGSCWGIFFSPPSNFVIYKIWIFSLQNLAKLVKFALGKKKISEISESFGWNNNNFCLGKKNSYHVNCKTWQFCNNPLILRKQYTNLRFFSWALNLELCRWPKSKKSSLQPPLMSQLVLPGSQFGV